MVSAASTLFVVVVERMGPVVGIAERRYPLESTAAAIFAPKAAAAVPEIGRFVVVVDAGIEVPVVAAKEASPSAARLARGPVDAAALRARLLQDFDAV